MAGTVPKLIVIRSFYHSDRGHAYYKSDGSVVVGEQDMFSTLVKIKVEAAASDSRYVHLRFCYSNRYWARKANDSVIVAASKQPEEDITKSSCTLFEPMNIDVKKRVLYLRHVQSGGRVEMNDQSMAFYVDDNKSGSVESNLSYVDWETLVKLPAHVAFKGDNGMYLKANRFNDASVLQFTSSDANETASGHQVSLMPDGRVQIYSDLYKQLWWSGEAWVFGDWSAQWDSESAVFTPVKIDDNTIALRSNGNYCSSNFCKRLTADGREHCLAAKSPTITNEARLGVEELVLRRTIYDARYMMEDARIYDEKPFKAGRALLINDTDEQALMAVEIKYEDLKSFTFSRSSSLTAGVNTTFEVDVPLIETTQIQISFQINTALQWDTTTTTTTSVTASGSVPVPANTRAVIEYVGTVGTCDIPYTYTQKDVLSTDGSILHIPQVDGIYTGVNSYNFHFLVASTHALA